MKLAALVPTVVLAAVGTAQAQEPVPPPQVVSQETDTPPKTVHETAHFKPEAHPSPAEVHEIAAFEQERWGGPSIIGRISCESQFNWAATNGQYRGLLQIGPIWSYLYGSLSRAERAVRFTTRRHRDKPIVQTTTLSDGTTTQETVGQLNQKVVTKHIGRLPASATAYHGFAAITVGQRAVSGAGPTTAWSCPL